jgi:hypothetical protein
MIIRRKWSRQPLNQEIYGYAGAIARALGARFWEPSDYGALEQRLLRSLKDGLAEKDNRFMCVEADGKPWVVRHNPKCLFQVAPASFWAVNLVRTYFKLDHMTAMT